MLLPVAPSSTRNYEYAMFAFGVPFYLLMNVKFVGPITFILAQAAAAVLCDYIARDSQAHRHGGAVECGEGGDDKDKQKAENGFAPDATRATR